MPTIPDALRVAVQHHQSGRLRAAEDIYRQILQFEPDHPDTLHLMGVALAQSAQWPAAADHIQRAIHHSPDFAPFHSSLGNVLQASGQLDEAIVSYRRAIQLQADAVEAHNNLGNVLQRRGDVQSAVSCYELALQFRPDYFEALCNLAIACRLLGRFDDAVRYWQHALRLRPEHAAGFHDLGTVYYLQGQLAAAGVAYREALRLNPDCFPAYNHLGRLLNVQGRTAEAVAVWRAWLQREPASSVARHMIAAVTGTDVPDRASDDCVQSTFDDFAPTFEQTLTALNYCGPQLIVDALYQCVGLPRSHLTILDAGCGTGLCGPLLRPYAKRLIGVDLSAGMLDRAHAKGSYDGLIQSELGVYLATATESYDVIVAADTFNYFGDLSRVLTAAARRLRAGGWLCLTLERSEVAAEYELAPHGRYCHAEAYVRGVLTAAGFQTQHTEDVVLRQESSRPVRAMLITSRTRD